MTTASLSLQLEPCCSDALPSRRKLPLQEDDDKGSDKSPRHIRRNNTWSAVSAELQKALARRYMAANPNRGPGDSDDSSGSDLELTWRSEMPSDRGLLKTATRISRCASSSSEELAIILRERRRHVAVSTGEEDWKETEWRGQPKGSRLRLASSASPRNHDLPFLSEGARPRMASSASPRNLRFFKKEQQGEGPVASPEKASECDPVDETGRTCGPNVSDGSTRASESSPSSRFGAAGCAERRWRQTPPRTPALSDVSEENCGYEPTSSGPMSGTGSSAAARRRDADQTQQHAEEHASWSRRQDAFLPWPDLRSFLCSTRSDSRAACFPWPSFFAEAEPAREAVSLCGTVSVLTADGDRCPAPLRGALCASLREALALPSQDIVSVFPNCVDLEGSSTTEPGAPDVMDDGGGDGWVRFTFKICCPTSSDASRIRSVLEVEAACGGSLRLLRCLEEQSSKSGSSPPRQLSVRLLSAQPS